MLPEVDKNISITSSTVQPDGKLLMVGSSTAEFEERSLMLLRYENGIHYSLPTENEFVVYPNPIDAYTNIILNLANEQEITLLLTDISGRHLITYLDNKGYAEGTHSIQIEMPDDLAAGMYFLTLQSVKFSTTVKIIKD